MLPLIQKYRRFQDEVPVPGTLLAFLTSKKPPSEAEAVIPRYEKAAGRSSDLTLTVTPPRLLYPDFPTEVARVGARLLTLRLGCPLTMRKEGLLPGYLVTLYSRARLRRLLGSL